MKIFALNSFYIVSAIVIACCFLYIIFILILPTIKQNILKKNISNQAIKSNKKCEIIKASVDGISFVLKTENKTYNVKVLSVPKNCDLQVNNIDTWMIYKKSFGSGTLSCKEIDNMTSFMKSSLENRIVILSSKAKTIKKVINECEMIMVKPDTNIYGVNIINFDQIEHLFKTPIKEKSK